jgi:hypothetical protein
MQVKLNSFTHVRALLVLHDYGYTVLLYILYCDLRYSTVPYCTVQYSTVLYCTVVNYPKAIHHYTVLYCKL